jgi:hypothetical protein
LLWIAGSSSATTIEWISPRPGRFRARASARVASRNGKRGERYTEPNQPVDPTKDRRINAGFYGVAPSPGRQFGVGLLARLSGLGDPPRSGLESPGHRLGGNLRAAVPGLFAPRHGYRQPGIVWAALASGHLASFDRRKCKVLNGQTATGQHCPEGWTLYPLPGPQLSGVTDPGSAEAAYYTWVDQHDTLGLGKDVPIATGNENDALLALVNGKFVTLRLPYPIGFYAKGMGAQLDDQSWPVRNTASSPAER